MSLREIAAGLPSYIAGPIYDEADRMEKLQRQYDVLLEGYHRQERTMKEVAARLRAGEERWAHDLADELDPQEGRL